MRLYPFALLLVCTAGACVPMGQVAGQGAGSPSGSGAPGSPGGAEPGGAAPGAPEAPGAPSGEAAGPTTVSVTIRSSCPTTVKVFYGDKPKFGSGTQSSVDSNSVSSHTFKPGDMFWIVDDSENGITSTTVQATTSEIQIGSSCKDLVAH